jgi:hypothetical protein
MTLVGLDLDATRVRAVAGPAAPAAAVLRLGEPHAELPLAVSLEGRQPQVGRAALRLCRRLPDCACLDFLPHLGGPRRWVAGRHCLDAAGALNLAFEQLARGFGKAHGVVASLPSYLADDQVALLGQLAEKARWRLLGTVSAPLAAVRAAHEHLPWSGLALVLDVDGHALTWSAVAISDNSARQVASQPAPHLARGAWLGRLMAGVAHRCIRQSRRDPCESAEAEQNLYDQLVQLLEAPPAGEQRADVVLQAGPWYQRLSFQGAELAALCQPLVRQALAGLDHLLQSLANHSPVGAVVLTAAAAHLPGLAEALQHAGEQPPAVGQTFLSASTRQAGMSAPPSAPADDDFGEGLLQDDVGIPGSVHVLAADAVARAAHELAVLVHRGDLPASRLGAIPLPAVRSGTPVADAPGSPSRPHDTDFPSLRLRLPPRGDAGNTAPRWRIQPRED